MKCHLAESLVCFLSHLSAPVPPFQSVTGQSKASSPVSPSLLRLEDFYMTNTISRASPTMAKCVQAVTKQRQSKYN